MKMNTTPSTNTRLQSLKRSALALIPVIALTCLISAVPGVESQTPSPASKTATQGKIHHTGYIWLKEPGNKEHQQRIIDAAYRFAAEIPEVRGLSVGKSVPKGSALMDTTFDVSLTMYFESQEAMERYNKHPVHQKAAQEDFLPLSAKILFYDFVSE